MFVSKRYQLHIGIYLLVGCSMFTGCVELPIICSEAIEQQLQLRFRYAVTLEDTQGRDSIVARDTFLIIDRIEIADYPQALYEQDTLQAVQLPLHPQRDSIEYRFFLRDFGQQQLGIGYRRSIQLISPECGVKTEYSNIGILFSTFDSVHVSRDANRNYTIQLFVLMD